jgi:hypothetical protein
MLGIIIHLPGQLAQHVFSNLGHYRLPGLALAGGAALLGLDREDLVQDGLGRVDLVGDVRVGVQAEHLGDVLQRHVVDEVVVPAQDDDYDQKRQTYEIFLLLPYFHTESLRVYICSLFLAIIHFLKAS